MKSYSPVTWAEWTQGVWTGEAPASLAGVCLDSRRLRSGELFVAIRTEQRDGHDFLSAALAAGAAAALVERGRSIAGLPCLEVADTRRALMDLGRGARKAFKGAVIGVTGSCGKTSTKEMLRLLLGERSWATPGNLNNDLGLPLSLLGLSNEDHDYGVFELGINHCGEMAVLTDILQPDYGIVTNVAPAHLQGMGSIANVAREKSLLLAAVENPRHCYCPSLCLEYMDFQKEGYQVVAEAGQSVPSGKWNLRMYSVETYTEESKITLQDIPNTEFRLASTGPGMVSNAALAIALACDLGRPIPAMISALANWRPSNMRAQWKEWQGRLAYVDCYNSNPRSLTEAGIVFHHRTSQAPQRLWVLGGMGELGEQSAALHRKVAEGLPIAATDTVIGVGAPAKAFESGLVSAPRWFHFDRADQARAIVESFEGPLFFKGSRSIALEVLLPESVLQSSTHSLPIVRKKADTSLC